MIKKVSLLLLLGLVTTGCSSMSSPQSNPKFEWLNGADHAYGDRKGDVCYTCGENFTFIPNEKWAFDKHLDRIGYDPKDPKTWHKLQY